MKMLTQTVRKLETHGLFERTVYPVVPPIVDYRLTQLGLTLHQAISVLNHWAMEHIDEVIAVRQRGGPTGAVPNGEGLAAR